MCFHNTLDIDRPSDTSKLEMMNNEQSPGSRAHNSFTALGAISQSSSQVHSQSTSVGSSLAQPSSPYLIQQPNYLEAFNNSNTQSSNQQQQTSLVLSSEQIFLQMQQQYENQIRSLQLELNALRTSMQTSPAGTSTSGNQRKSSSASGAKRSQSTGIVDTYLENITVKEFSCKNCSYRTKSEVSLIVHNTNHQVNQRYLHLPTTVFSVQPSTHEAGSGASSQAYLYPCSECSGKFSHIELMLHIYKNHTGESPFHCDECDLFFMHYEFLDDHQRSTHQKMPGKKKPRYSSSQMDSSADPPALTYYSVLKCSKPFTVLSSISRGSESSGAAGESGASGVDGVNNSWNSHDGSSEMSPALGSYPYHSYHSSLNKRGRARGGGVTSSNGTTHNDSSEGNPNSYKCHYNECYFISDSKERLDFHLSAHRNSRFKCIYCPYLSNDIASIKRHIIKSGKHDGALMFRCPNGCQFASNCDKSFRDHIRSVHFGKQIDDKSLTLYIEELFANNQTEPQAPTSVLPVSSGSA